MAWFGRSADISHNDNDDDDDDDDAMQSESFGHIGAASGTGSSSLSNIRKNAARSLSHVIPAQHGTASLSHIISAVPDAPPNVMAAAEFDDGLGGEVDNQVNDLLNAVGDMSDDDDDDDNVGTESPIERKPGAPNNDKINSFLARYAPPTAPLPPDNEDVLRVLQYNATQAARDAEMMREPWYQLATEVAGAASMALRSILLEAPPHREHPQREARRLAQLTPQFSDDPVRAVLKTGAQFTDWRNAIPPPALRDPLGAALGPRRDVAASMQQWLPANSGRKFFSPEYTSAVRAALTEAQRINRNAFGAFTSGSDLYGASDQTVRSAFAELTAIFIRQRQYRAGRTQTAQRLAFEIAQDRQRACNVLKLAVRRVDGVVSATSASEWLATRASERDLRYVYAPPLPNFCGQ